MMFFLGPLPPPVHGFSVINAAMLQRLREHTHVEVFDRTAAPVRHGPAQTSPSRFELLRRWCSTLLRFSVLALRKRPRALYAGVSGGAGQALDLPFLAIARCLRIPIFVHHHSFAYLHVHSRLMALYCMVLGQATHVVLCQHMAQLLAQRYRVPREHVSVLSNVAFLPPTPVATGHPQGKELVVGFLSNITIEKGIFEFFDMMKRAQALGLPVRAIVAGPVDADIRVHFGEQIAALKNVRHAGPVYEADKAAFFQAIDMLVFPSKYANEAEPVTVLEALSAGVEVMAAARGCVGDMIPTGCGSAVPLQALADQWLSRVAHTRPETLRNARAAIRAECERLRVQALEDLRRLLVTLTHSDSRLVAEPG